MICTCTKPKSNNIFFFFFLVFRKGSDAPTKFMGMCGARAGTVFKHTRWDNHWHILYVCLILLRETHSFPSFFHNMSFMFPFRVWLQTGSSSVSANQSKVVSRKKVTLCFWDNHGIKLSSSRGQMQPHKVESLPSGTGVMQAPSICSPVESRIKTEKEQTIAHEK